jgi:hypothetical protein
MAIKLNPPPRHGINRSDGLLVPGLSVATAKDTPNKTHWFHYYPPDRTDYPHGPQRHFHHDFANFS